MKLMATENLSFNDAKKILFPSFEETIKEKDFPALPSRDTTIAGFHPGMCSSTPKRPPVRTSTRRWLPTLPTAPELTEEEEEEGIHNVTLPESKAKSLSDTPMSMGAISPNISTSNIYNCYSKEPPDNDLLSKIMLMISTSFKKIESQIKVLNDKYNSLLSIFNNAPSITMELSKLAE